MQKMCWVFSLLMFASVYAQEDESRAILKKIDTYRVPYQQFFIKVRLTSFERDAVKETAVFDCYINGNEKSLVIAKKYKTKGMKILYVKENMWVHLPDSLRPIRITPIQRLMGQASNGDVARVSYVEDYSAQRIGEEVLEGIHCDVFLLVAKKKSTTYHRIILYVRKEDYRPQRAKFYLISGKHFKTAYFETYKPIRGSLILEKMTIYDELKEGNKTTFEYLKIDEKKLQVKYFNKNYLIHVKNL